MGFGRGSARLSSVKAAACLERARSRKTILLFLKTKKQKDFYSLSPAARLSYTSIT
jgi:hypothetical protein